MFNSTAIVSFKILYVLHSFVSVCARQNSNRKVNAAGPQTEPKTLQINSNLSLCNFGFRCRPSPWVLLATPFCFFLSLRLINFGFRCRPSPWVFLATPSCFFLSLRLIITPHILVAPFRCLVQRRVGSPGYPYAQKVGYRCPRSLISRGFGRKVSPTFVPNCFLVRRFLFANRIRPLVLVFIFAVLVAARIDISSLFSRCAPLPP